MTSVLFSSAVVLSDRADADRRRNLQSQARCYTASIRQIRMATTTDIPKRSLFRASDVCSIAKVQAYVLRSWEAEFPALGASKSGGGRVYRRADVEMVLEIKRLLYEEGLTLGAARRRIGDEQPAEPAEGEPSIGDLLGQDARERITEVKEGLRSILALLSTTGGSDRGLFDETPAKRAAPRRAAKARAPRQARAPRRKPSA